MFSANALQPESPNSPKRHAVGPNSLGWGLIGAGSASGLMADAIRALPPLPAPGRDNWETNSWVVGIFSHDDFRARHFTDAHHIPHAFVNLADLLTRPDVRCVYIGGLPRHRAQAALAALAAGKHVLAENPIALTEDDALAIAHTAAQRGLTMGINYRLRADPAVQMMREMLRGGEIGDALGGRLSNTRLLPPHMQTWRLQPNGGGVLIDRTLHDLDLLRYLLRDEIVEVYARASNLALAGEVEEDLLIHVETRRSGQFQLHDSFVIPHSTTGLELYGSTATLIARQLFVEDAPSELTLLRSGIERELPLPRTHAQISLLSEFASAVRSGSRPLATAADGLRALEAGAAVLESLRSERPVALPPVERAAEDHSIR